MAPHATYNVVDGPDLGNDRVNGSQSSFDLYAENPLKVPVHEDSISHEVHELKPIAIIGFSLKFPQEATSAEGFWKMLTEKRCCMTEFPRDRANIEAFYHPDSDRLDTVKYLIEPVLM